MRKKDYHFFSIAKSVSKLSDFKTYKGRPIHIGAVIVYHKSVISMGYNRTRGHPLQKELNLKYNIQKYGDFKTRYTHPVHAEINAIVNAFKSNYDNLVNASMYIYREHFDGTLAICRPCAACMALIKQTGISKIYYTTKDGYCEEVLSE